MSQDVDPILSVFFPDPWPKKRHRKRRLMRPELVVLLRRKLCSHAFLGDRLGRLCAAYRPGHERGRRVRDPRRPGRLRATSALAAAHARGHRIRELLYALDGAAATRYTSVGLNGYHKILRYAQRGLDFTNV